MIVLAKWVPVCAALGFGLLLSTAAPLDDRDCLACHSDKTLSQTNGAGRNISLFVDAAAIKNSAHSALGCAACHDDLTSDHPDDNKSARAASCASCHEAAAAELAASAHKTTLSCLDCLGLERLWAKLNRRAPPARQTLPQRPPARHSSRLGARRNWAPASVGRARFG